MASYTLFLKDFFNHMVDIFRNEKEEEYNPVGHYPNLKAMREMLFKKYDVDVNSIDEKALIEQLPENVKLTLDEKNISYQNFVDVVFLKRVVLEDKFLSDYIQKVKDIHKSDDNWTKGLYHFQSILEDKGYDLEGFKKELIACFDCAKKGQRFELLSNVAVFIEAYGQTHEGKEFFTKEFDLKNPEDAFLELFRRMNNASVFNTIELKNNEKGRLKCSFKAGSGGDFDGLYIFPDDKGGLMVRQVQISATSDIGTGIEKNSVFRHAISNIIIAKALDDAFLTRHETHFKLDENNHWEEEKSLTDPFKVRPSDFINEDEGAIQTKKQEALLTIMKEKYSRSFGDAKTFKSLVKHLNANLYDYISECFGEGPPLKAHAVKDTVKGLHYVNVSNVLVARTSYKKHKEYEKSTLGQYLENDVDLNMKEFRHGLQLVALSTYNQDNKSKMLFNHNEGLELAFSGLVSRCVDDDGNVDETRLNRLGQSSFEKLIFDNFIFAKKEDIQRNYDVINNSKVKVALNDYIHFIVLGSVDGIDIYDQKIKEMNIETPQTLKETCEKLMNIKFFDIQSSLSKNIQDRYKRIESENKIIESDIKNLNSVLKYPDDKEMYSDNISGDAKLEELYNFLKKRGYNGRDNKVKTDDYRKALIEVEKKNRTIDELEYPTIDNFNSSNKGETVSKSSYKLPKSKK